MNWPIVLLASAILLAFAGRSLGADAMGRSTGRVLLVVDRQNDPFMDRIQAEVTGLGFMVVAKPKAGSLEADAREQQAIAAIAILPSRKGVEVWMADAASGRSLLRQVIVDERPGGPDQGLIALQTAELLRTGLLGPAAPVEKQPEPTPVVVLPPPPPPPPSSETAGQAGFGFLFSPGGVAVAPMAFLSVQQVSAKGLGLSLDLGAALRNGAITGVEGQARFLAFQVGAAGLWRIRQPGSPWSITTGLGLALARFNSAGDPDPSHLLGRSSSTIVGMGYGRVFLGREVTSWLDLGVGAMCGATFQRVVIHFAGNEAATFGWPLFSATLMAELH